MVRQIIQASLHCLPLSSGVRREICELDGTRGDITDTWACLSNSVPQQRRAFSLGSGWICVTVIPKNPKVSYTM